MAEPQDEAIIKRLIGEGKYNVGGFCRELPDRVAELHKRRGDRIPK